MYALVEYHGIKAQNLIGQMYDPFSYIRGDPFDDWAQNRLLLADWFTDQDIQLLIYDINKSNYEIMVGLEPEWFRRLETEFPINFMVYEVSIG